MQTNKKQLKTTLRWMIGCVALIGLCLIAYGRYDRWRGINAMVNEPWSHWPSQDILTGFQEQYRPGNKYPSYPVQETWRAASAKRLATTRFVELSPKEARLLTDMAFNTIPTGSRFYLLRSFQQSEVSWWHGYLLVASDFLTHRDYITLGHYPVVVLASHAPKDVFTISTMTE